MKIIQLTVALNNEGEVKRKKTPWFPADINPVRPGVYRVEKGFGICWAHWDGRRWSHAYTQTMSPDASVFVHNRYAHPVFKWRGLQGDEHSLEIGESTYLVEFGDEGRDRPGDDE